jgi:hypothetical protein
MNFSEILTFVRQRIKKLPESPFLHTYIYIYIYIYIYSLLNVEMHNKNSSFSFASQHRLNKRQKLMVLPSYIELSKIIGD